MAPAQVWELAQSSAAGAAAGRRWGWTGSGRGAQVFQALAASHVLCIGMAPAWRRSAWHHEAELAHKAGLAGLGVAIVLVTPSSLQGQVGVVAEVPALTGRDWL
eukprot:CAMPEP_0197883798 /NCGR_PEP_ID=MMETSP1439-20131203/10501_1 /TAXON_ID=66791 /ORGANISM="Gonyaulax spinifera, Strain CCMP409" /LENGTH=103 /DNA_ID=CAMNT_0043503525 /DNA_START=74 /DNA_END=383 /DNA_ORIENTATION=-